MCTPREQLCIPVAFTSDIALDTQFEFLRFKQPIDKASMTLLHYVVSRYVVHCEMGDINDDFAKLYIFYEL